MLTQTNKKTNWLFNVLKLFFAFVILLFHILSEMQIMFCGYYVFVEAFFIISGIYLYKSAVTKKMPTHKYMLHKYLKLLPALLAGAIIATICANIENVMSNSWTWEKFGWSILAFVIDTVPVIFAYITNGNVWFVFALLWLCLLLYPLVKKFPKIMTWVSLVIGLGIYFAMMFWWGNINAVWFIFNNSWLKQLMLLFRAASPLCVGIFIGAIGDQFSIPQSKTKNIKIVHSICLGLLLIATIIIGWFKFKTKFDFLLVGFFWIICFLTYYKSTYLNNKFYFNSEHISGISLFLFTCHTRIVYIFYRVTTISVALRAVLAGIISIIVAVGIYFAYYFVKRKILLLKSNIEC